MKNPKPATRNTPMKKNTKRSFSTTTTTKHPNNKTTGTKPAATPKGASLLHHQQRRTLSTIPTVLQQSLHERTNKYPLCTINTLPSGLKVATEHSTGELASVSVAVEAGSRFENDDNNGTAHFLEHCFFKGTTKRTRTQLETLVENIGGSLNAFTTREQVVFTITTQREHLPIGVELLSDMIQNSTLSESAIQAERHPILEEYESVANELQEVTYDQLHASVFRGSSLAYDILGPIKNIRKISKSDVEGYRRAHYTASKVLVTGVGDFTAAEFQALVAKHFATLPTTHPPSMIPNRGITPQWTSTMHHFNDTHQRERLNSALALAFPTPGQDHPDHYALMTIQMGLNNLDEGGDGIGSSAPFNTQYSDVSLFGLYLQTTPGDLVPHTINSVTNFVNRLKAIPDLLEPSRDQLKSALLAQYEGSEAINLEVCRQVISHGRRLHPTEVLDRINNVNQDDIARITKEWFDFDKLSGAVVGIAEDVPDLDQIKAMGKNAF